MLSGFVYLNIQMTTILISENQNIEIYLINKTRNSSTKSRQKWLQLLVCFSIILSSSLLTSCSFQDKIIVGKPENILVISSVNDTFILGVTIPVENYSRYNIELKESKFMLLADNTPFGKAIQIRPVLLEKNMKKNYDFSFQANLFENIDLMSFGLKSLFGKAPDLKLTGTAIVRSGLIKKTIPVEISLNDNWKQIRRLLQR
jgi:hypothetical protein